MDVHFIADIGDDGHADVREFLRGEPLRFAEFRPIAVAGFGLNFGKRRELHAEKSEVADAPVAPPVGDHVGVEGAVFVRAAGVGFALVPDGAANAEGDDRRDHRVVEFGRFPVGAAGRTTGGFLPLGRELGGVGIELGLGFLRAFQGGGVAVEDVAFVGRIAREHVVAHPDLGRRTAPRRVNQPDRHLERLFQIASKIITNGREARRAARIAGGPTTFDVRQRRVGLDARDGEKTDVRIGGSRDVRLRLERLAQRPLHVRLPAANPHFADEYVLELHARLARDREHGRRGGGGERLEFHGPLGAARGGGGLLTLELHRDLLAVVGPAPDRERDALLQDHVIGENRRQLHVGERGGRAGQQRGGNDGGREFRKRTNRSGCEFHRAIQPTAPGGSMAKVREKSARRAACSCPPAERGVYAAEAWKSNRALEFSDADISKASAQTWVAQATSLCRPATRRTEWVRRGVASSALEPKHVSLHSAGPVTRRHGRVARATRGYKVSNAPFPCGHFCGVNAALRSSWQLQRHRRELTASP